MRFVSCHRDPKRSFFYKGTQFPMCARCTGIYVGYLSVFYFMFGTSPSLLLCMLIIAPTVIDGLLQYYTQYESNNAIRVLTGFAAGVGLMGIASLIGDIIIKFLLSLL